MGAVNVNGWRFIMVERMSNYPNPITPFGLTKWVFSLALAGSITLLPVLPLLAAAQPQDNTPPRLVPLSSLSKAELLQEDLTPQSTSTEETTTPETAVQPNTIEATEPSPTATIIDPLAAEPAVQNTSPFVALKPKAALPTTPTIRTVKGISEVTLPSGQMLYIKEDHSNPIVTIDTWVTTGSVNETANINGVSHFLEHLLFKGTDRFQQGEIDRLIESKGATFNAATSDDFTHYYITLSSQFFKEALDIHADMLLHSIVPEAELTPERKVVQEEINRAEDKPQRNLLRTISEALFNGHGYALDTLGPKSVIASIPRQNILNYYHYWYQPEHLKTVIVGDVDTQQAIELVQRYFDPKSAPGTATSASETTATPYVAPIQTVVSDPPQLMTKIIEDPNVSQCYLALAFLGPNIDNRAQSTALDVGMQAIGSGKSSPLYQKLKEELNLVTSVSAGNWTQKYAGLVYIMAEVSPEKLPQAQTTLLQTLQDLKQSGITPKALEKTKTQTIKDFIFLNESTDGIASSVGYNVAIGTLEDYAHYVDWIQQVTLEQANASLKQYLDFNQAVLVEVVPQGYYKTQYATTADAEAALTQTLTTLAASEGNTTIATNTLSDFPLQADNEANPWQANSQNPLATESTTSSTEAVANTPTVTEDLTVAKAPTPTINKTTLPNGMTLITKQRPDSETVALKIFIKGGKMAETVPGTSSLLSYLLKKGTLARTVEEINTELESKGMALSVSSANDYVMVSGYSVSDDLGELFLILQDVLNHPTFAPEELAKAKEQMKNVILSSHDEPATIAVENATLNLYPWHPYGNVGQRVMDHLDLITQDTISTYFNTYFIPERMVVSAVGNFDPTILASYLSAAFPGSLNQRSTLAGQPTVWPDVQAIAAPKTVEESKAKQAATWIAKGWLGPDAASPDYAAFKVLNSLLGTGMSSRLFVDLREKQGLAYAIASELPTTHGDMSFMLHVGTAPENEARILKGFDFEVNRLKSELVDPQELQEAKDKLSGAFALAHETNDNQAFYLGFYETLGMGGKGYTFDATYHDWIQSIAPADIQRVAKQYLSSPAVLSIVAPEKPGKKPTKPKPEPIQPTNDPTTTPNNHG